MQDNPSTNNIDTGSNTPFFEMDREDWEMAFEAFQGTGYTAIRMRMNLRMLYKYLDALAMEVLFPLTEFHKTTFDLFLKYADCELTFEEEQMIKALGIKV